MQHQVSFKRKTLAEPTGITQQTAFQKSIDACVGIKMAWPQESEKVMKSFNQKRKKNFDDNHNFHVIIAPGRDNNKLKCHYSCTCPLQFWLWHNSSVNFRLLVSLERFSSSGYLSVRFTQRVGLQVPSFSFIWNLTIQPDMKI